ncbi:MAG: YcnI family protein [Acidimicrobiales bacterium]
MRTPPRALSRVLTGTAVVVGGIALFALPASAHVEIQEHTAEAGSTATLTFGVPHGCEESPTTKIRISLPESVVSAVPTLNANWDISLVKQKLDTPIDVGEGETVSERVTEVDFAAKTPLPIGFRDDLKISVPIPEDAAGTTLTFPTVQECVTGSTEWTQLPAKGQDPEELAHPAPSIEVVAASAEGEDSTGAETMTTIPGTSTADKATTTVTKSDDNKGIAIAGLATGIAGIVVGGAALATASKKRAS